MNVNKLKKRLLHYTWDLAYGNYNERMIRYGLDGVNIRVVKNPFKNKWFADPFILEVSDRELHLLVEEFDSDVKRGRIAHLTIDKQTDKIMDCKIVLDLPNHLSFPAIYRVGEDVIVHPENSAAGKSYMYRYDREAELLVDPMCICEDPIADAIIVEKSGHYEMYATRNPNPNGDMLIRYEAERFTGPYKEVAQIVYKSNLARMAGTFIPVNGGLIRPAQDCNGAYGRAVLFMDGEQVVSELRPKGVKFAGIHTFNTVGSTFVIDLKKYDFAMLYYIKTKVMR